MKELKLNDDTILELSDVSSNTDLVTVVKSWGTSKEASSMEMN